MLALLQQQQLGTKISCSLLLLSLSLLEIVELDSDQEV